MKQKHYKTKRSLNYTKQFDFESGKFIDNNLQSIPTDSIILFLEIKEFQSYLTKQSRKVILKVLYNGQLVYIPFYSPLITFKNSLEEMLFDEC